MAELSTRQLEHGLALLVGLDLGSLLRTLFSDTDSEPTAADIQALIPVVGGLGERRILRKLAAIMAASAEELRTAEQDPACLLALEEAAALQPWSKSMDQARVFFTGLGLSLPDIAAFSMAPAAKLPQAAGDSLSAAS